MIALLIFFLKLLVLPSKPAPQLEAENAALRQQVAILQRKMRGRVRLTNSDRLFFVLLYRWFPSILKAMTIIQPETVVSTAARSCSIADAQGTGQASSSIELLPPDVQSGI